MGAKPRRSSFPSALYSYDSTEYDCQSKPDDGRGQIRLAYVAVECCELFDIHFKTPKKRIREQFFTPALIGVYYNKNNQKAQE